eukprot:m.311330 g.311330  ORF g.311330 m.311330 type:complete len:229 (+) comp65426_c0_seq1:27-713(+)
MPCCIAFVFLLSFFLVHAAEKTCIGGYHHKAVPSPETNASFAGACGPYKANSCCTTSTAVLIEARGDKDLYNFHWDDCGVIPAACETYLKAESCFYECSPNLGSYLSGKGSISRVPICSRFCDGWFDACKDVRLCAANWITDFVVDNATGRYHCLNRTVCRTFADVYKNGKGVCEIMWGKSFYYEGNASAVCYEMDTPKPETPTSGCIAFGVTRFFAVFLLFLTLIVI